MSQHASFSASDDDEVGRVSRVSLVAPDDDELSLLELADRLLHRGVVITGEATISVAGVDLIYLGLNVVLTAVENLKTRATPPARDHSG
jgi:gas vesicle structural protein